ncbi:MAG TPA: hypothetical protein VF592_10880 [Sphingomonas sp.]|jgi:hypothetical protein|uniref:hypothetical protein n=1 Tax=Sphingomonas sp. TaxID=28214 RepID=UPI002EDAABE7
MIILALMLSAYTDCLSTQTVALERSGDSASDVAEAVITACVPLDETLKSDWFQKLPDAKKNDTLRVADSVTRNNVRLQVIQIRAGRSRRP